jgi:hypothetical protein
MNFFKLSEISKKLSAYVDLGSPVIAEVLNINSTYVSNYQIFAVYF